MKFLRVKVSPEKVENFFFNLLHGAEELRRKEMKNRGDMLQLMLDLKNKGRSFIYLPQVLIILILNLLCA